MSVTGFGASVLRVKEDLMYECSEGCMGQPIIFLVVRKCPGQCKSKVE